ncbi:MAG: zinc-ribbon and DUF3426 domain-containing protein [Wenzhouxiangellaceae bacterium]|nr:zinc-ribbon and DUF3426 domain-containing protein [Wenzhouxiangellaceae bacterium]
MEKQPKGKAAGSPESDIRSSPEACGYVFTRCEHCRAVLPVRFSDLGQAGGMVRCGSCGRTLNALAHLYPEFPDDSSRPIAPSGMPPMLQPHVEQEQIIDSAEAAETPEASGDDIHDDRGPVLRLDLEPEPAPAWMRFAWPALALILVAVFVVQLVGPERWRIDPGMLGLADAPALAAEDAVQMVSRDMHPHPSLDDAFIISAVLINRSPRPVAWPNIELELFDASQQTVARRRLAPDDYLSPQADRSAGFKPDVRLPLVLEMAVESSRPSGFSMTFYY